MAKNLDLKPVSDVYFSALTARPGCLQIMRGISCTLYASHDQFKVSSESYFFNRDLKIEVFRHFPRTENVKKSRDRQVCGLRFTFVRLDHAPEVSDI